MSQYGNYKPKWLEKMENENKGQNSRFKAFFKKVAQRINQGKKRINSAVFAALVGAILICTFVGCKHILPMVQREEVVTKYVDSTIWHNDTNFFEIPVEIYRDYTGLLDTLRLENKYSIAWSAMDTNNMILLGELKSKNVKVPVEYKWKERIIYQDTTIFKEKEIPVPVEKEIVKTKYPWWSWICLTWTILCLVYVGFKIYLKFWKQ